MLNTNNKLLTINHKLNNQSGQSLLEVTLALGILVVILGAMAIVTIEGLRNSQFSKNQAQATKLAQEGIDAVKTIKFQNCPVSIGGTNYYWSNQEQFSNQIWNGFSASPNVFSYSSSPCFLTLTGTPLVIGQFRRTIALEHIPASGGFPNRVRVISLVSWEDASGPHESNLTTILTDY